MSTIHSHERVQTQHGSYLKAITYNLTCFYGNKCINDVHFSLKASNALCGLQNSLATCQKLTCKREFQPICARGVIRDSNNQDHRGQFRSKHSKLHQTTFHIVSWSLHVDFIIYLMHLTNAQMGKNNLVGFLPSLGFRGNKQSKSDVTKSKVMQDWRKLRC